MLFVVAQFWRPSSTFCIFDNSPFGILSDAVQSSAYLHIFTRPCISTGIESSKSSIKIPNSKGDMTDPCGTPAGQVRVVDSYLAEELQSIQNRCLDIIGHHRETKNIPSNFRGQVQRSDKAWIRKNYECNIIGDELLLNFGAKFQRYLVISHVKLQNCHGNPSVRLNVKMATKL